MANPLEMTAGTENPFSEALASLGGRLYEIIGQAACPIPDSCNYKGPVPLTEADAEEVRRKIYQNH